MPNNFLGYKMTVARACLKALALLQSLSITLGESKLVWTLLSSTWTPGVVWCSVVWCI